MDGNLTLLSAVRHEGIVVHGEWVLNECFINYMPIVRCTWYCPTIKKVGFRTSPQPQCCSNIQHEYGAQIVGEMESVLFRATIELS